MATAQLQLITAGGEWKLDRRTIEIGRAGLAAARAALDQAVPTPTLGIDESAEAPVVVVPVDLDDAPRPARRRGRRVSEGQGALSLFGEELLAA